VTSARWLAFQILKAVEEGAFASDLLEQRLTELDSRDAGLATELVFGVLRYKAQLDWAIGRVAAGKKLDLEVRVALEIGAYQRLFLTRIPAHAAVSESVEMARAARKGSAAGLVNAVLRRIAMPREWPDRQTRLSIPVWLLERWDRHFGKEAAECIAAAALQPPETYVHLRADLAGGEGLEATEVPDCWRVRGEVPAGARRMDIGSQAVAALLDLKPGARFLDVCAAPGNKTAVALEAGVIAVACDASFRRLAELLADCPRVQLDAARPLPFGRIFDRILVDAPCSGTGTLGRNPEIKWRIRPDDLHRHPLLQRRILENALACLKPGGRLVYSTCSLEPEENREVVERAAAGRVLQAMERLPGRDPGDGFQAFVISSDKPGND
jgi:16S rRNA (cytosine967-C5)-methyltransferase